MALTTVDGSLISSGAITLTTQVTGTLPVANGGTGVATAIDYGFRNRLINGGMVIDQRNAGASVTPTNGQFLVDRWQSVLTQASKYSCQQNAGAVTPPVGFINYLGATSVSAYAVLAGDYFGLQQRIEGLNCTDLAWGTANAKTVTLSFQVYSSLTGTFGGVLANNGFSRTYPFSYSIPVANTWTAVSVTIAGDTSGTWLTTNGTGIAIRFSLGTGSTYSGTAGAWASSNFSSATGATSVVGTNGATFYITGVQLEKGSTATSFDYRPYGTELALCQRYCWSCSVSFGMATSGYNVYSPGLRMPVTMRSTPTIQSGASFSVSAGSAGVTAIAGAAGGIINSADNVYTYNSSGNWTAGSLIAVTAILTAEL